MRHCAALAILLVLAGTIAHAATEPACIPDWTRAYGAPVIGAGGAGDPIEPSRADYISLIEFGTTSDCFGIHADPTLPLTEVFSGNYNANTVTRHAVDGSLNHTEGPLPVSYGQAWYCDDLDNDGSTEVVLQRGDTGMGGNGYLDILSAPDWRLRAHITLAGLKVYFYPTSIDVDGDGYRELYLSPSSLGGTARVMVVGFDQVTGNFVVTDNLYAPNSTGGPTAAADFDGDGRVEFITGHGAGYELYEYTATGLVDRGVVGQPYSGNCACALRPVPGGGWHALLGHSSFNNGYRYQLLRPTGDNTFEVVHVFQEVTGWAGVHPCHALDADNDGLDEVVMNLYPNARVYGWDTVTSDYVEVWHWDQTVVGTLLLWRDGDLDFDGRPEWCCVNHNNLFRAFEDQENSAGVPDAAVAARLLAVPNPFTARTTLALASPRAQSSIARILDAQGRLVRECALPAEWDGRDGSGAEAPPGVYFLTLGAGRGQSCRLIRVE